MENVEKTLDKVSATFATAQKDAMDAALKMNALVVKAQGEFAKQHMGVMETVFEAGSRQLKLATETRDPAEFMSKNAEIVVSLNEKLVSAAQDSFELHSKVRDEFAGLVEENVKRASAGVSETVAAKPAKATRKAA